MVAALHFVLCSIPMTILVADTNPAIRTLMTVLLEAWHYEVMTVASGQAVLDYLRHHTPELMILEGGLHGISGLELCSRIKRIRRLRVAPVILLLHSGDEMARVQASLVNANGILTKPISGQNLREILTEFLTSRPPND